MYKMVSEYGNAVYYVDTETEKERFLRLGYHEETAGQIKKPKAAGGGKRNAKTEKDKN